MTTLIPKFDFKDGGATPTGAVNRPINQKLAETVSVHDFGAVGDGVADDTVAIQNALDSSTDNIVVLLGGKGYSYKITDTLNITGSYKVLDGQGSAISAVFASKTAIAIRPLSTETQLFSGVCNIDLYGNLATGASNIGIQISGKSYNAQTENIKINYFGLGLGSGYGFHVVGGTGGGNAPYFGDHFNIKVNQCHVGFVIEGANSTDVITTNNFTNCYAATCDDIGMYMLNCTGNTLINYVAESNAGIGLQLNYVNGLYAIGGFIEGNTPNIQITNSGSSVANFLGFNTAPPVSTVANYANIPAFYLAYATPAIKTIGSPIISIATDDIIPFSQGKLTIMVRSGEYAEFLLTQNGGGGGQATEILATGSVNPTFWSTTKDSSSKWNVYWNSTTNRYEFQSKRPSALICFQQFVESS